MSHNAHSKEDNLDSVTATMMRRLIKHSATAIATKTPSALQARWDLIRCARKQRFWQDLASILSLKTSWNFAKDSEARQASYPGFIRWRQLWSRKGNPLVSFPLDNTHNPLRTLPVLTITRGAQKFQSDSIVSQLTKLTDKILMSVRLAEVSRPGMNTRLINDNNTVSCGLID